MEIRKKLSGSLNRAPGVFKGCFGVKIMEIRKNSSISLNKVPGVC